MSKIVVDIDEFAELVPFFIGMFIENSDMIDDTAADFYMKVGRKIKADLRQFIISVPNARQKFKLLKPVFSGDSGNGVITIKADKLNKTTESKYLTENQFDINETIRRNLN